MTTKTTAERPFSPDEIAAAYRLGLTQADIDGIFRVLADEPPPTDLAWAGIPIASYQTKHHPPRRG